MRDSLELVSDSPQATRRIGASLGRQLRAGDIVLLVGDLGTGKTCLVQGIARGLGISEFAQSPSFVLVREHRGRLPLYHVDLYRLDHLAEIADLGLEDYFYGGGVTAVEWAEKGEAVMPPEHLLVRISYVSDRERRLKLLARGWRYQQLLGELGRRLERKKVGR